MNPRASAELAAADSSRRWPIVTACGSLYSIGNNGFHPGPLAELVMFLGIEIGGTKLQLGVGSGSDTRLAALERLQIEPRGGADGILAQIETAGQRLLTAHAIQAIGVGFGGPVDSRQGSVLTSHQVRGWQNMPLVEWCRNAFGLPTVLGNDCDAAALAEARLGAGRGKNVVFYVTVGSGIGGGLVIDGELYRGGSLATAEIGHLRPGLQASEPEQTVESIASGWGIAAAARALLTEPMPHRFEAVSGHVEHRSPHEVRERIRKVEEADEIYRADLLAQCNGLPEAITAQLVCHAASAGNVLAQDVLRHAAQALGWAVAQAITLLAPQVVVMGGGVSLAGEEWFFEPLRREVARYVFPPLARTYDILPASLGELTVVHGALLLARNARSA